MFGERETRVQTIRPKAVFHGIPGSPSRMRLEKAGSRSAARARSLMWLRRLSSAKGSDVSIAPSSYACSSIEPFTRSCQSQGRRVADVLLRFTNSRAGVNRYQSVVAVEKKVAGMKVTVKQDRLFTRALTALDSMGEGYHGVVVAAQSWV
jgi:hypothetical protein